MTSRILIAFNREVSYNKRIGLGTEAKIENGKIVQRSRVIFRFSIES